MTECRPKNYPKLKDYKPSRFMLPTCHYDAAKADRAVIFIENLRHTKGKWAGKRFWLLPWQEQIIRDVFGIVDEKGNRQFRTAYVEIGKKNGKSELAAAVALYLLFADNEPSAEVYGAAADRQQASIVFDVAHQMVQMTPALLKRCKIMAATKRIVNYGNAGFYQVLSAEVGTKHGLNVSGLVLDEVHAQLLPGDKVDAVESLMKFLPESKKLAFVGDGINDAPVLSRADVGIAMGSMGSDAAIEAADVVLMDDDPGKIADIVRISRKTMGIVMQNIVFALGVKFVVLAMGAFGVANMWEAVFADVGVTLLAVLNSMRALKA